MKIAFLFLYLISATMAYGGYLATSRMDPGNLEDCRHQQGEAILISGVPVFGFLFVASYTGLYADGFQFRCRSAASADDKLQ